MDTSSEAYRTGLIQGIFSQGVTSQTNGGGGSGSLELFGLDNFIPTLVAEPLEQCVISPMTDEEVESVLPLQTSVYYYNDSISLRSEESSVQYENMKAASDQFGAIAGSILGHYEPGVQAPPWDGGINTTWGNDLYYGFATTNGGTGNGVMIGVWERDKKMTSRGSTYKNAQVTNGKGWAVMGTKLIPFVNNCWTLQYRRVVSSNVRYMAGGLPNVFAFKMEGKWYYGVSPHSDEGDYPYTSSPTSPPVLLNTSDGLVAKSLGLVVGKFYRVRTYSIGEEDRYYVGVAVDANNCCIVKEV